MFMRDIPKYRANSGMGFSKGPMGIFIHSHMDLQGQIYVEAHI